MALFACPDCGFPMDPRGCDFCADPDAARPDGGEGTLAGKVAALAERWRDVLAECKQADPRWILDRSVTTLETAYNELLQALAASDAAPSGQGVDDLADWLGDMDESRNVFDYTDEATTFINIDVETLAERFAARVAAAVTQARAEERERIATAIEAQHEAYDGFGGEGYHWALNDAAAIARQEARP